MSNCTRCQTSFGVAVVRAKGDIGGDGGKGEGEGEGKGAPKDLEVRCPRCVLLDEGCTQEIGWTVQLSSEVDELDRVAVAWERGELGGGWLWLADGGEAEDEEGEDGEAVVVVRAVDNDGASSASAVGRRMYVSALGPGLKHASRVSRPAGEVNVWRSLSDEKRSDGVEIARRCKGHK
jgi:hypothetical protein